MQFTILQNCNFSLAISQYWKSITIYNYLAKLDLTIVQYNFSILVLLYCNLLFRSTATYLSLYCCTATYLRLSGDTSTFYFAVLHLLQLTSSHLTVLELAILQWCKLAPTI